MTTAAKPNVVRIHGDGMDGRSKPAIRVATGKPMVRLSTRETAPNGAAYDHRFIASTELLASDGGVILLDGWRVGSWLQRPRWIANHNLWVDDATLAEVTLGRGVYAAVESGLPVEQVGISGRALTVYVRYASTPFAQEVKLLYEEGGLDDVSVRWDWQTEETRQPYEEEVALYGEDLYWVCTRADLMEVSAVMLGADSGAQIVRGAVMDAFERVRSTHQLPQLEAFVRKFGKAKVVRRPLTATPPVVTVTVESATTSGTGSPPAPLEVRDATPVATPGAGIDPSALQSALNDLAQANAALQAGVMALGEIAQLNSEAMTAVANLLQAAVGTDMPLPGGTMAGDAAAAGAAKSAASATDVEPPRVVTPPANVEVTATLGAVMDAAERMGMVVEKLNGVAERIEKTVTDLAARMTAPQAPVPSVVPAIEPGAAKPEGEATVEEPAEAPTVATPQPTTDEFNLDIEAVVKDKPGQPA